MKNKYSYWLFNGAIHRKDRDKIKRIASKSGYSDATIHAGEEGNPMGITEPSPETRKSGISFIDQGYIYQLLCPYINGANESAGWNFDIDWVEPVQIARYSKNEHYTWHRDGGSDAHHSYKEGINVRGKVRKLSLVTKLSDNYTGGELQFSLQGMRAEHERLEVDMEIGDVIVFPSFVFHRSAPVTKGIKYSATMWSLGSPFK